MPITSRLRTSVAVAAAASAFAFLGAARPATAQSAPYVGDHAPVAIVRAGAFLPFNSQMKDNVGKIFYGGGLDYIIHREPTVSRTEVSVDYIERSSGGNDARIIPLTIGQFMLHGSSGEVTPYLGFGAGAYFIHQSGLDASGARENDNKTAIGGYIAAGLDLPDNLIVEARYHIIQKVGLYNSSGLQLMAGIKF